MLKKIFIVYFLVFTLCQTLFAKEVEYERYLNARFKFAIDYPKNILVDSFEPDNSDGKNFFTKDKRVVLSVFGGYNVLYMTLEQMYKEELSENVTYSKIDKKNGWFVVSGIKDDKIYYTKTFLRGDPSDYNSTSTTYRFLFVYPKSESRLYNKITAHISKSFAILQPTKVGVSK